LYYIEYHLNAGGAEPGELKIRRNVQDALKKVGGTVIFDDNFNKTSTITVKKDNKETWVEVRSYNNMYRIYIVEREIMKQEIVANAEAMEMISLLWVTSQCMVFSSIPGNRILSLNPLLLWPK